MGRGQGASTESEEGISARAGEAVERPSLKELTQRIDAHLKRMEADPSINVPRTHGTMTTTPFYNAFAYHAGRYVGISCVSYQNHADNLTRDEAEEYLAWLDAGNNGPPHKAL